eukprot:m51a1_g8747 hypothetical protein (336) ;mRNA; f:69383-71063
MSQGRITVVVQGTGHVPGDRVVCTAALRWHSGAAKGLSLAFQLRGTVNADPKWVRLPAVEPAVPLLAAPGPNDRVLFASPPTAIASDKDAHALSQNPYCFAVTLPTGLPPSFRGVVIRYVYSVVVVATVADKVVASGRATLRVISPCAVTAKVDHTLAQKCDFGAALLEGPDDVAPSLSPRSPKGESGPFAPVLPVYEKLLHPGDEHLVRVAMRRAVFRPGDIVTGVCDYSGSHVLCNSMWMCLEAEETLDEEYAYHPRVRRPTPRIVGEAQRLVCCADVVPFEIPLPIEACHEFAAPEVSLRWLLSFRFGVESGDVSFSLPVHVIAVEYPPLPI